MENSRDCDNMVVTEHVTSCLDSTGAHTADLTDNQPLKKSKTKIVYLQLHGQIQKACPVVPHMDTNDSKIDSKGWY